MFRVCIGAALALCVTFASPSHAAFCKTLKGEWVGFGEDETRKEAESRLDNEIAAWRERYNVTAVKAKNRKSSCGVYLKILNEYLCTANAVVCR